MYLIVGGDSVIGKALGNYWEDNNTDFHSSTRKLALSSEVRPFIDLENLDFSNLDYGYDVAILCAAVSSIAKCELHKKRTRIINVINTYTLLEKLSLLGTHIIFLSSNQVFDGSKPLNKTSDRKKPVCEYGKQKAEAEDLISNLKKFSILRLSKVIHPNLPILIKWSESLEMGQQINAFADMSLSPIDIGKVVLKIDSLAKSKVVGIFHCSGGVDMSYYDYAIQYVKRFGYSENLVNKESCKSIGLKPPLFTSLSPH